ncbi:MAG: dUTP diphosphatase [Candidatus Kerfeldbacteria bacterium]
MTVKVQKLHENAKIPEYAHQGDAGMDIFALEEVTLQPGQRHAVPTGIAMQIPTGHVALVWDKSGRAVKEGLKTMAGVIDEGYRGEVKIVLNNLGQEPVVIEKHQKIAQILIQPVVSPSVELVDALDATDRGEGGFGSTGL